MSIFSDLAAKTGLPEPALAPILNALETAFNLTVENNERVAAVQATNAKNKNDHDYIDSLWKTHAASDETMRQVMEEFYVIAEQYEEKLKALRTFGATKIPEELSEETAKNMRALVNSGKPAIETARAQAESMAIVIDNMLELQGAKPEGGILSLMPPLESLKQARGRKAGSTIGPGGYMTKVAEVLIDGVSTNRDGKGKFNFAADDLSKAWGAETFAGNRVTPEELEVAYLKSHGYESRVAAKEDGEKKLPAEASFKFSKTVEIPSKNDDSTQTTTKEVTIKVMREVKAEADTNNAEPTKVETPKVETQASTTSTPAPAKKAAPAKQAAK